MDFTHSDERKRAEDAFGANLLGLVFDQIARLNRLFVVFLAVLFLFILVFGERNDVHRMHLRHFQLDVTLRATQNLAFFHFVFVQIHLGVAFGTLDHGIGLLVASLRELPGVLYTARVKLLRVERVDLSPKREYPSAPIVGVGGVVIRGGRALLIKRGGPPLQGQWSIPGGTLELGESLQEGVRRELLEETGIEVKVLDLIEVFDRIFRDASGKIQYHFVIVDYLCEALSGEASPASDVTHTAWVTQEDLKAYNLTEAATRVLTRAYAMRK
jgi:8-oxo-dGTP diphosphatase